jgi:signal transduction histidine kinase
MSVTAELDSAATALAAAGIEAEVDVSEQSLPEPVDTLLAMVLREAVTNVIRHSAARTCAIAVGLAGVGVRLEVTNDGAPEAAQPGIGLEDLADRLRSVGGDLTAGAVTGTFRLVAEVPMSMAGE